MIGENVVLTLLLAAPVGCALLLGALYKKLRRQNRAARWYHILVGNVLLLVALLGTLCLSAELYFRYIYDTTDSFAYSKVTQRWFERYWVLNDNGIRDNVNYALERQPGRRRITFLGDSFTAGHGIKSVEDRFANILRREHGNWEVHAMAVPGYDTRAEAALLDGLLERGYQIDQVVLVYCLNDISDLIPELQEALRRIAEESKSRPWFVRSSYFLDVMSYRLRTRYNRDILSYYDLIKEAYRGPLWEVQKRRLKNLRDSVESHGGHFAVVMFPFFHTLGPRYAYAREHQQLREFWSECGVPDLDLLSVYRGSATQKLIVSAFDAHPNEEAHAMAATAIGRFLEELFKERPANTR